MTTAIYVADRALRLILAQASDAPLEADEYQDFYSAMNDFMADLKARGVDLGYTAVTGPADTITIPPGAIKGLISNMAIEVAPDYMAPVSAALTRQAQIGMRAMRKLGQKRVQISYPTTLPRGSGNEWDMYTDNAFYNAQATALLTLTNNVTATEIAAVDTPVRVAGFWQIVEAVGLVGDIGGRLRNATEGAIDIDVIAQVEVIGGAGVTLHLYENGNESLATQAGTADGTLITLRKSTTLLPNEHIELWIENDVDAADLTVRDCQFQVV